MQLRSWKINYWKQKTWNIYLAISTYRYIMLNVSSNLYNHFNFVIYWSHIPYWMLYVRNEVPSICYLFTRPDDLTVYGFICLMDIRRRFKFKKHNSHTSFYHLHHQGIINHLVFCDKLVSTFRTKNTVGSCNTAHVDSM